MVVVVLFYYQSRLTWLELKSFVRVTQAKKQKKSQYFQ